MLIIRFSRVGKRNHAQFRVVLTEKSAAVKSKPIEVLGGYDPHQKKSSLKEDRIKYWISQGAQLSDSAYNLMVSQGIIEGRKRLIKIKSKSIEEGATEKDGAGKTAEDRIKKTGDVSAAEAPKEGKKEEIAEEEKSVNAEKVVEIKENEKETVSTEIPEKKDEIKEK
jgi:small subunit ribosomal protein S16